MLQGRAARADVAVPRLELARATEGTPAGTASGATASGAADGAGARPAAPGADVLGRAMRTLCLDAKRDRPPTVRQPTALPQARMWERSLLAPHLSQPSLTCVCLGAVTYLMCATTSDTNAHPIQHAYAWTMSCHHGRTHACCYLMSSGSLSIAIVWLYGKGAGMRVS